MVIRIIEARRSGYIGAGQCPRLDESRPSGRIRTRLLLGIHPVGCVLVMTSRKVVPVNPSRTVMSGSARNKGRGLRWQIGRGSVDIEGLYSVLHRDCRWVCCTFAFSDVSEDTEEFGR